MFSGSEPLFHLAGIAVGLREGVIALIALVALYMLVVVLRMRRLSGRRSQPAPLEPPHLNVPPPEPASAPEAESLPMAEARIAAAYEVALSAPAVSPDLPETRSLAAWQEDLAQLREELDAVRGELAALREDMYQELAHVRAAQTVSPIYGDAMQMAVSGYDAAVIAERCGIARAEAELVVALANSRE